MPGWVQLVIAAAAFVTACTVLWRSVIRPGAEFIAMTSEMLPVMRDLLRAFDEAPPQTFKVLADIAAQFRTDSGSSLRDVVNRLEDAAGIAAQAATDAAQARQEIVEVIRTEFNDAFLTAMAVENRARKREVSSTKKAAAAKKAARKQTGS